MVVDSGKHSSSEKIEYPALQVEQRKEVELPAAIKSLEEEELQISELREIEKTHMSEMIPHLKKVMSTVGTSIHIEPSAFSEVILTPEGNISLVNNGSEIRSIPLEALPGSAMVAVLTQSVPELKRMLVEKKTGMSDRVIVLDKSVKEFRKVSAAISATEKRTEESSTGSQSSMDPMASS